VRREVVQHGTGRTELHEAVPEIDAAGIRVERPVARYQVNVTGRVSGWSREPVPPASTIPFIEPPVALPAGGRQWRLSKRLPARRLRS